MPSKQPVVGQIQQEASLKTKTEQQIPRRRESWLCMPSHREWGCCPSRWRWCAFLQRVNQRAAGKILQSVERQGCHRWWGNRFRTKQPERKPVNHDALEESPGRFLLPSKSPRQSRSRGLFCRGMDQPRFVTALPFPPGFCMAFSPSASGSPATLVKKRRSAP